MHKIGLFLELDISLLPYLFLWVYSSYVCLKDAFKSSKDVFPDLCKPDLDVLVFFMSLAQLTSIG